MLSVTIFLHTLDKMLGNTLFLLVNLYVLTF